MTAIAPQLPLRVDAPPTGDGWVHEIKWDGDRCVADVSADRVSMTSRSRKSDYSADYPAIAAALATLPDGIYDGELVANVASGGDFEALRPGCDDVVFVAFDLVECMGFDVRSKPLAERRELLDVATSLVRGAPGARVALSPAFVDAPELLTYVRENGMEGIVSKRLASPYRDGTRSADWQKTKIRLAQAFVVVGWKEGEGSRSGRIGSILLAARDAAGRLRFVGRCGTGGTLPDWDALLLELGADAPRPDVDLSAAKRPELRGVHWVVPDVVVQVEFQRWTCDGRLFHPSLKGVRRDKDTYEVSLTEHRVVSTLCEESHAERDGLSGSDSRRSTIDGAKTSAGRGSQGRTRKATERSTPEARMDDHSLLTGSPGRSTSGRFRARPTSTTPAEITDASTPVISTRSRTPRTSAVERERNKLAAVETTRLGARTSGSGRTAPVSASSASGFGTDGNGTRKRRTSETSEHPNIFGSIEDLWPRTPEFRYRIYAIVGGDREILATSPTACGVGMALITIHEDQKAIGRRLADLGRIGVLDVLPGGKQSPRGEWVVQPYDRRPA